MGAKWAIWPAVSYCVCHAHVGSARFGLLLFEANKPNTSIGSGDGPKYRALKTNQEEEAHTNSTTGWAAIDH